MASVLKNYCSKILFLIPATCILFPAMLINYSYAKRLISNTGCCTNKSLGLNSLPKLESLKPNRDLSCRDIPFCKFTTKQILFYATGNNLKAKIYDINSLTQKDPEVIPLYKAAIPNSKPTPDKENSTFTDNVTKIAKVSKPTLTIFKPVKPNGKSVIICPGGGYTILAIDKEGTRVAEELNRWGITAFVLKYRLPDDSANIDKSLAPLQDAQQAIRLVRTNAKEWGLNKNQIGIMGFSAGGHLASSAATHFKFKADADNTDTTSVRPDFAILIYPVISFNSTITHKGSRNCLIGAKAAEKITNFFSNELQVDKETPPSFLVHAGDDSGVPVENSIRYYQACIKTKVPVEMHLYPKGGHGFGMYNKTTDDNWLDRLKNWINRL